jgi:hypothetical protein
MVVVVAIIALLLGLVVPNVASMWRQRNEATSATKLRGLLESARVQAIQTGARGLFFFVDDQNEQRVVFIEAEPPEPATDDADCLADGQNEGCITERVAVDRFRVVPGSMDTIPAPYRVAPRWVIENVSGVPVWEGQLGVGQLWGSPGANTPRYHRNHFTVIFEPSGELVVGRHVLIHDRDANGDGRGDLTGLRVYPVDEYWLEGGNVGDWTLAGSATDARLYDMVTVEQDGRAANFISVGEVVVYDESAIADLPPGQMCTCLLREAQPFYVNRYTGDVIRGPRGE